MVLDSIVQLISDKAQEFYDQHFASDDPTKITLKLAVPKDKVTNKPIAPAYNRATKTFTPPEILFGLKVGSDQISRPQSFLNEAKFTQLALSVRFAASLVNLHQSDLKLLVLDDLLVSLDMSNRMKVVQILLSDASLANYQKIILTHDLGFFQEFKRIIGANHQRWLFQKLVGNAKDGPKADNVKSALEMAQQFLANDQIAECGNQLRKCVEANLTSFLEQAKQKKGLDHLIDREAFASLHHKLNEASSELSLGSYREFAELLQAEFTLDQLQAVASPDEIDPAKFAAATKEEKKVKGKLIAKLYAARPNLHQGI
jgi:wobble nucleotide-excising tRNase